MKKPRDKSLQSDAEQATDEIVLDLKRLRGRAVGVLESLLERCEARAEQLGDESYDKDLTLGSCQLAKTLVSMEAEARQQARAARAAMEELSTQRILAYLRQATTGERKTVLRELQVIEGGGGVLG